MRILIAVLVGLALGGTSLDAQKKCVKGIPCGNTCISADKVCRVGRGSAGWRSPEDSARVSRGRASAAATTGTRTPCAAVRVIDGDTIECDGALKVRLIGIDSPEMDQGEYGNQAREALLGLLPASGGIDLEYDVEKTDRYGRALAYAWAGNRHLNLEMIQKGWAMILTYPPNVRYAEQFRAGQASARVDKRGLWAIDAFACTPKDHRDKKC